MLESYLMAVEDISPEILALACNRFIRGQVQRPNLTFRPFPPELAVEARRLQDRAWSVQRATALPPPPPEKETPDPTPEERQRCAEMWARAKAEIEAAANTGWGAKRAWVPPSSEELVASRDRIAAYMAEKERAA